MAYRNVFRNIFFISQSFKQFNYFTNNPKVVINMSRKYLSDYKFNNEEQTEVEEEIDDGKTSIRNLLYENSKDTLILKLNESASVQNVFNIIRENHQNMNSLHISQAVLVLWDLQKIFYNHNIYFETDSNTNNLLSANAILQNYIDKVNSHEDFDILIKLIEANYEQFSLDALTCTLLYLNRMGVKLKTNVMQEMIIKCEKEIKNCDIETFPLKYLSRFIVTVFSQESLYPILVTVCAMPIVLTRLDTCETKEDFKLLTICLHKMHQLVSTQTLAKYKTISEKLIENTTITNKHLRTILKAIRFLNQPQWFEQNSELSNKFIHILKGSINQLSANELIVLFKVFQVQKEPADMLDEMHKHATQLLKNSNFDTTLELLSFTVYFSSPLQRDNFEQIFRQYIKNNFTDKTFTSLYKIFYYIKSSDIKLCNYFWDKSLNYFLNCTSSNKLQNILTMSYKYMHFCNNVGYKYRYYNFEQKMLNYFNKELNSNILTSTTSQFCRISSFIIAFSEDFNYTEKLLNQLLQMSKNFKSNDCKHISRGLQYLLEKDIGKNSNLPALINSLNTSLNNCATNELKNNFSLLHFNMLLRSYTYRKENIEEVLFTKLLDSFVENSNYLNSHIIKDLAFCLQTNNCLIPQVVNKLTEYISKKKEIVLGNTADKVLYLCYSLGYTPEDAGNFFNASSEIITRDKDKFSALTFLQLCLALCFYHKLPETLIKRVFSVDFLEKLDEELGNCYSKTKYPLRVRDNLMQLNRAVCLDYPEADIPWFHQKYIEEKAKTVPKNDFFHKELNLILKDLIKNTKYTLQENIISPYGYYINFVLNFKENDHDYVPKIAILQLHSTSFSNFTPNLRGYYQLKQRHLEILGYNVIKISYEEWKSFYTQKECKEYVKKLIWPVNNKRSVSEINL